MISPVTVDEINNNLSSSLSVEKYLDGGGQGGVFLGAYDSDQVAVKIINPDSTEDKRIERELRFLSKIDHPNIVKVLHSEKINLRKFNCPVVVYEYLRGGDLEKHLNEQRWPEQEVVRLGLDISNAITAMWNSSERVVHRDIKPKNIMKGNNNNWVLVDYAFARHIDMSDITVVGGSVGTPGYKSPEQALGRRALTFKSDVYSLGVTLFYVAFGVHPFNGQQNYGQMKIMHDVNQVGDYPSNKLKKVILSMLAISPSKRPANLVEIFKNMEL